MRAVRDEPLQVTVIPVLSPCLSCSSLQNSTHLGKTHSRDALSAKSLKKGRRYASVLSLHFRFSHPSHENNTPYFGAVGKIQWEPGCVTH